jgi:ADP-heptose:LPS heptosyltransferase
MQWRVPNCRTYAGFNQGQYGDIFIGLTAARVLKRVDPGCNFLLSINRRYQDCKEIFKLSKDIDDIVIWDTYNDFPGENDLRDIERLNGTYTDFNLFDPMPQHVTPDWYNHRHQTEEFCLMHDLPSPTEEEMNFQLSKPEVERGNYICICPATSFGRNKNLTSEIINEIKSFCSDTGLELIQVSGPEDPLVDGAERFVGSFYESILKVLSSKFLVSADTGMIWAISAFSHPTIGFYSYRFYGGAETSINWRPKNTNQISLESDFIENIGIKEVANSLERLYDV